MFPPQRIQGTDGLRGKISFQTKDPLVDFVEKGLISPELIEIYCYTWARLLLEDYQAGDKKTVILAQDPRDKDDIFLRHALQGIEKAGLEGIYIGQLPTPAVPYFLLEQQALGGIMLTASHNPHDEHGIKLFQGKTGLKYLPDFEERLTQLLFSLPFQEVLAIDLKPNYQDQSLAAKNIFTAWLLELWQKMTEPDLLADTFLVIDCSKGATSEVAKSLFPKIGAEKVYITNTSEEGLVNQFSGVADLEGHHKIARSVWQESTNWQQYKTLNLIFQLAAKHPPSKKIIGIVFDGDGDRFFRLDYDPKEEELLISGGDKLVAQFLANTQFQAGPKTLVSTIETDVALDLFCQEKGWQVIKKLVGDKWVQNEIFQLLGSNPTALNRSSHNLFGFEESGHFIFPIPLSQTCLLTGNGIYAALIALSIQKNLLAQHPDQTLYRYLAKPYQAGKSKTFSIYYVDKAKLEQDSFKHELQRIVKQFEQTLPDRSVELKWQDFPEEKALSYFQIERQGKVLGSLFIRNSGTEDKASINLRSLAEEYALLEPLAKKVYVELWGRLKVKEKTHNQLIYALLSGQLSQDGLTQRYPKFQASLLMVIEHKEKWWEKAGLNALGKELLDFWQKKI